MTESPNLKLENKACRGCLGACSSTEDTVEILHGESSLCANCPQQPVIQTVSEQYRSRRPRWWQVQGRLVVPIWIVDRVKHIQ
jgi:hypothetical protein